MAYKAEYIWIDGTEPTAKLRSKTKIIADGAEPRHLGLRRLVSTNQAPGGNVGLRAAARVHLPRPDPRRRRHARAVRGPPHRHDAAPDQHPRRAARGRREVRRPGAAGSASSRSTRSSRTAARSASPTAASPAPQGRYYCGVGADEIFGRDDRRGAHRRPASTPASPSPASTPRSCPASGSSRSARSARSRSPTSCGWPAGCSTASPRTSASPPRSTPSRSRATGTAPARHTNFSTKAMRESYDPIITACEALGKNPQEHVDELRLRHRGPPHRPARDRPVERVQLRRVEPRRLGPHPVAGRGRQEGLHRGSSPQRQLRPVRRHQADRRHLLRRPREGRPGLT